MPATPAVGSQIACVRLRREKGSYSVAVGIGLLCRTFSSLRCHPAPLRYCDSGSVIRPAPDIDQGLSFRRVMVKDAKSRA